MRIGIPTLLARTWIVAGTLMLVLIAVPLLVAAGPVTVPNTFSNGTTADADEMNANFNAVKAAVDDNDSRITTAQSTADAAAAGHTTNTNTQLNEAQVEGFITDDAIDLNIDTTIGSAVISTGAHTVDTTYSAGSGISMAGTSFSADTAVVQARVSGNCAVGEAIAAIAADGTVTCEAFAAPPATGLEACADGLTVADHDTGLLWQKKTGTVGASVVCETAPGGCPDPHDVNNTYEWSNSAFAADGNAFTDFLAKLNDPVFGTAPDITTVTGCFAALCDWRLPVITELRTIVDCGGGAPCIDPLFGPTASSLYWSASTVTGSSGAAWTTAFDTGFSFSNGKTTDLSVRAVRTGSCTH